MTETTYRKALTQFLYNYWGAFHEALEAQSVTPRRLAESLFGAILAEHRAFAAIYSGPAKDAVSDLGDVWRELEGRRYQFPDAALTHDHVMRALNLFREIHDSLMHQPQFEAARKAILQHAPHGTPTEPLHADAAR